MLRLRSPLKPLTKSGPISHLGRRFAELEYCLPVFSRGMILAIAESPNYLLSRPGSGTLRMMFVIEIFGKPDSRGNAVMIERRTHTGSSVTEALRTAQANLRTPPPSAYSFSMKANGKEVGRWRRGDDHDKANVLDDLESANANPRADGDEY
jgi:hypothetical protein